MNILQQIQSELKAPKGQKNNFGNYSYRSAEDILTAVKPLLEKHKVSLIISDLTKKGMDDAQITGSASSYARKYALNGLFAIDDTKDPDATNDHGSKLPKPTTKQSQGF